MPYTLRKVNKKPCYRLKNRKTKHIFAKCSSLEKAKKQLRLLNALAFNKSFKLLPRNKRPSYIREQKNKTKRRRNFFNPTPI